MDCLAISAHKILFYYSKVVFTWFAKVAEFTGSDSFYDTLEFSLKIFLLFLPQSQFFFLQWGLLYWYFELVLICILSIFIFILVEMHLFLAKIVFCFYQFY